MVPRNTHFPCLQLAICNGQEDDGGVVRVMNGGTVDTAQQIRHYADSIIVVAEPGQELVCQPSRPSVCAASALLGTCTRQTGTGKPPHLYHQRALLEVYNLCV